MTNGPISYVEAILYIFVKEHANIKVVGYTLI